jgi:hypothetical protein
MAFLELCASSPVDRFAFLDGLAALKTDRGGYSHLVNSDTNLPAEAPVCEIGH